MPREADSRPDSLPAITSCYHPASLELRGEKTRSTLRFTPRGYATPSGRGTAQRVAPPPTSGSHIDRRRGGVRLPYMPGLDGLRALAVIAVLLYHGGLTLVPGGVLGG